MTSTPFTVGLNEGKRLSSRVLRPPGGGHTDIFGGEPDTARLKLATPTILDQEEPQNSTNGTESSNGNGATVPETIQEDQSKAQPNLVINTDPVEQKLESVVEGPPQNERRGRVPPGGFSSEAPSQNETQKRGRVPPGGFSSPLW